MEHTAQNSGLFIGSTFSKAWQVFKQNWLKFYGIILLPVVIGILYFVLIENIDQSNISWLAPLYLTYLIIQLIVSIGVFRALLLLVRNEAISFQKIMPSLRTVVNYVAVTLLFVLIVVGGLLLLILPGIIFMLKYIYAPYIVADKDVGPIEALKLSSKMTAGAKWDMIGFYYASIFLVYAGFFALLIGLLVSIPVATLSYVIFYVLLLKRAERSTVNHSSTQS